MRVKPLATDEEENMSEDDLIQIVAENVWKEVKEITQGKKTYRNYQCPASQAKSQSNLQTLIQNR